MSVCYKCGKSEDYTDQFAVTVDGNKLAACWDCYQRYHLPAKTELRLAEHSVLPGQKVFEIWHGGQLIGTVCGADGPGVRVISKHPMKASFAEMVVEVLIDQGENRK
jgi:hypothetical protein